MWIVRLALNRPYTFVVLAILILIASPVVIMRTPTDIFPSIDIPVVSIAWQYTGLSPEELEGRLTTPYEKALTTLVILGSSYSFPNSARTTSIHLSAAVWIDWQWNS